MQGNCWANCIIIALKGKADGIRLLFAIPNSDLKPERLVLMYGVSIATMQRGLLLLSWAICLVPFTAHGQDAEKVWNNQLTIAELDVSSMKDGAPMLHRPRGEAFEINILWLRHVDDQYLRDSSCWNVRKLSLLGSPSCTDSNLVDFLKRNCIHPELGTPTLERLTVDLGGNLTGDFVDQSIDSLSKLHTCSFGTNVPPLKSLELLGSKTPITRLSMLPNRGKKLSKEYAKAIASMPRLRTLILPYYLDVFDGSTQQEQQETQIHLLTTVAANCPQLSTVIFPDMPAAELAKIKGTGNWEEVRITFASLDDLAALKHFPKLKHLDIDATTFPPELLTAALADHGELTRLEIRHFDAGKIPPSFWDSLKGLAHLRDLDITYIKGLTAEHCDKIATLSQVTKLALYAEEPFDGKAFSRAVGKMDQLEVLAFGCSSEDTTRLLGGFDISDIAGLVKLRRLYISDDGVRRNVPDGALPMPADWAKHLQAMTHLDFLDLDVFDKESPSFAELLKSRPYLDEVNFIDKDK